MDRAHDLGPASLGTLNGTGYLTRTAEGGYTRNRGVLIVDGSTLQEVEALRGQALTFFGPTEDGDVQVGECYLDETDDFPTVTFSTTSTDN